MRGRLQASGLLLLLLASGAAFAEHRSFEANRNLSVGMIDPAKVALEPTPIRPEWIIEGSPRTLAAEIAHTDDGTTRVYVWQTTASRFHWNYEFDEVVQVLDGEVFVSDQTHPERRLGPGDIAFFPFGAQTVWRVPDHLRKIATIRRAPPSPIADLLRWVRTAKHWLKPEPAFAG